MKSATAAASSNEKPETQRGSLNEHLHCHREPRAAERSPKTLPNGKEALDATGALLAAYAATRPRAAALKPGNETDPGTGARGGARRAEAPLGCVDTPGRLRQGQYQWARTGAVLSVTVGERQEQRRPRPSPGLLLPSARAAVRTEGCRAQLGGLVTDPLRLEQRPRLREGAKMPVYFANELEASTVSGHADSDEPVRSEPLVRHTPTHAVSTPR